MHAYLYARWSSLEQAKGSTLTRQIENCNAYALKRNWVVEEVIIDRGRSAYTGDNITSGNLGLFAGRLKSGAIPAPACLVVEELDRLSRQPADVMLTWLSPLVRAGLTIAVTQTGQTIDCRMLDYDMGGLMMLMIGAFGSHTESRKKSERVEAAWAKKRDDARAGLPVQRNHRHPKWLCLDESGELKKIKNRCDTVAFIFKRRLEGLGKGGIAKELNAAQIPTWSRAAMWTPTYVGRILSNRAVLGEWQPHAWPRKAKSRKPVGEAISGYYPQVIDESVFVQANELRLKRQLTTQGRGQSISNLLGSKAICGKCGGKMAALGSSRYRQNRDGTKSRHYFLYCENAKVGKSCDHQIGWTYDRIEAPLLDNLLSLAMDDAYFAIDEDLTQLEAAVLAATAEVSELATRAERLLVLVEEGDPRAEAKYRALQRGYTDAERKLEEVKAELEEARGAVTPDEHLRRVAEVRELIDSEDSEIRFQARRRVKAALHDLISVMSFNPDAEQVDVRLVGRLGAMWIKRDGWSHFENLYAFPHRTGPLLEEDRATAKSYIRRLGQEPAAD